MKGVCSFHYRGRMDGSRRRLARVWVPALLVLILPSTAFADGLFTPFAGVSFGNDQTEKVTTFGASLAGMAGGIFGFELDFGQTADAKTDAVFAANSRVTTVTGNVIVGVPLGAVRPYVVGGLGWLRTSLTADGQGGQMGSVTSDGLGVDIGGGLMGFFGDHVGARADIRYIRAVTAGESVFEFDFEQFNFVRFTGGLVLRF